MALTSKISDAFSGRRQRCFLSDEIDSVLLNVTMDDSEDQSVDITNHAIEDGSDIVDNTWQKPLSLSLNCVLSDDISDLTDWSIMAKTSINERKKILKSWMDDKIILTLYSWDTDYENMLVESVSYKRSQQTGTGVGLQLNLKQVNIVETQLVENITVVADKGKQPVSSTAKTGVDRLKSLQKQLWDLPFLKMIPGF